ncbi:MAG: YggS family pyridoxal phosphate-dependent enzyme [Gammaproteobacteria bacterium]|nr:MAG: YggS family pyridoxal phosphate-dependent enzyme [Gammaproteobacteria bacterium]
MPHIASQISALRERVDRSLIRCNRPVSSLQILAVSKTQSAAAIEAAYEAGFEHFGENYLQEALLKIQQLQHLSLQWHYIGTLQSNKTSQVAQHFDWFHTLDRLKIAQRLSQQRSEHLPDLNVCIQVNIDNEPQKGGVSLAQLDELADAVIQLPRLSLRGLMAIPRKDSSLEQRRDGFNRMAKTLETLKGKIPGLDTLSMGMSEDLELAIEHNATIIRIGTAIFGPRKPK